MTKWRFQTVWWSAVAIAMLAGTINLSILASRLETAPDVLAITFQDAALGWFGWGYEPVAAMSGGRQADFWLAETERILAENPTSEMARGAAWMLDSPANNFSLNYWQPTDLARGLPHYHSQREVDEFEEMAAERCVELGRMATNLSPNDVLAWRTRARLLLRGRGTFGWTPRDPRWFDVLEEASSHDSQNAMYDYLAAEGLWLESTLVNYADNSRQDQLIVRDADRFAAGVKHFERGQKMAFAQGADADWQPVLKFLKKSRVPQHEQLYLLSSRLSHVADRGFGYHLLRVHSLRPEEGLQNLTRLVEGLRTAQQLDPSDFARLTDFIGDSSNYFPLGTLHYRIAIQLQERLKTPTDGISEADLTSIEEQMVEIRAHSLARSTALSEIPPPNPPAKPTLSELNRSLGVTSVLSVGIWLSFAALCLYGITRALSGSDAVERWRFSILRHSFAWLVAFLLSFALFGLAPAEIISILAQYVLAQLLCTLLPVVGLVWLFVVLRRQRKSRAAGLLLLIAVPLLGAMLVVGRDRLVGSVTRVTGDFVPSRVVAGMYQHQLEQINPSFKANSLMDAWIQWLSYPGLAVMTAIALALVACWSWNWYGRSRNGAERLRWKTRLQGTATETTRSAAYGATVSLLLFLVLAPMVLQDVQSSYDAQRAWFRGVPKRRAQLAAAFAAIEADPVKSAEMRQWAIDQIATERARQR